MSYQLAFVGGGQMATALASGAIASGMLTAKDLVFAEPYAPQREKLSSKFAGAHIVSTAVEVLPLATRIVLSVKPQVMGDVCRALGKGAASDKLWISIAAGFSVSKLQELLSSERVVRIMPNTPAQIGAGAAGISNGLGATDDDLQFTEKLMSAVGMSVRVSDALMHAVTGLSGSGPAYVYLVIDA